VATPIALLMFESLFVRKFQFLQWARQGGFSSCDEAQLGEWIRNDLTSA